MSGIMETLKGRRSVRRFEEKDLPESILNMILESVKWSPSWANTQCWEVIVIKDHEIKTKIQQIISEKNPATKALTAAPVLIALCAKLKSSGFYKETASTKFGDWFMFDLGIAAQSICLEAHSMGLGTVIVGSFDHEKAKKALDVPEGYEVVTLIPIGYPAQAPKPPKRREISEFTHYDKF